MFEAKSAEPITKEFILSRITEEDIFLKYLNIYPDLNGRYKNPLRDDNQADCNFYRDSRGILKFKDFAYRMNLDCFNVVQLTRTNGNYGLALKQIVEDFKLETKDIDYSVVANWKEAVEKASKKLSVIQVKRKEFTKEELTWWFEQGIHKDILHLYKVGSLQLLWLNGDIIYNYSRKDPGYVYHFGSDYNYKAYFPFRIAYRFLQNISKTTLQGYEQLPKEGRFLVITKSLKDVLCLYSYDIPSIAPTSETILIDESQMAELQDRFFYIFTLFDRDRAGMQMSQIMRKKYSTIPLLFDSKGLFRKKEEPKDFTDHYKKYGTSYMNELVEEIKQQYL